MRIVGLASGMDIDALVKDLMKAERIPLDKMYQQKQIFEWKRDSYREINTMLDELDRLIFDGIYRQSSYRKKTVTSSDESSVTARAINATSNISATIEVSQLAEAASWSASSLSGYSPANQTLEFEVMDPGGTEARTVKIELSNTDTLDDVISKINSSDLGVTAMKIKDSNGTEKLVLTNNQTGEGGYIKAVDDATKNFVTSLGFTVDANSLLTPDAGKEGKNAIVKINGYETVQTSNTFMISGMEYTIKKVTANPVMISTATDVDGILDTIVKFVDKYNEVIGKINGKLTEERFRDYPPLTDEQKEEMTEKQIELWEEKAKSGLLRSDSILSSGLDQMRLDLYTPVAGASEEFDLLADIGITTTSNYLERGKLIIDEDKLREKIKENPEAIYNLFMADGDTYEEKGIARRLRDSLKGMMTNIKDKAGTSLSTNDQYTIGKNLDDLNDRIDAFNDRLVEIESRYYRQFTAMEQAIQRANQQSAYLMQFFGGGA